MKMKLSEIAFYVEERVNSDTISLEEYVTTDCILQNKRGRECATNLPPQSCSLVCYKKGDVLVANIRPYLKKIWYADIDGAASSDVLVFRAKDGHSSEFLFATLLQDSFYDYVMQGAKGSKMPRGDKEQIMRYEMPTLSIAEESIGKFIMDINRKIRLNEQINQNLEAMAKQLYDYWFVQFDFPDEEWSVVSKEAKELIKRMLTYNPKKRPSALELLSDPWFKKYESMTKDDKKLAKSALENMKRFKRNKQIEQATISFIVNQLVTKEERTELMKQFIAWDKNGDGVLSKEEIVLGYKNAYGSVDEDEIDNMIKSVDLDGNGVIDYNEFLTCTLNRDKIISKANLQIAFNTFDKDGSGAISIDEIMLIFKKAINNVDKSVFEKMLKDADENGDGEIEFEEFKRIMTDFFN